MTAPSRFPRSAGPSEMAAHVETWVMSAPRDATGIREAAKAFGRSCRSLQRELAAHGLSYADIRDRARCRLAKQLLEQTTSSLTDIALDIGYSELSAFSRSFKRQVGLGPSRYRAAALDPTAAEDGRARS